MGQSHGPPEAHEGQGTRGPCGAQDVPRRQCPVSGIMATIRVCTDCEEAKLLLPSRR